jgi:hypothetical protein
VSAARVSGIRMRSLSLTQAIDTLVALAFNYDLPDNNPAPTRDAGLAYIMIPNVANKGQVIITYYST